MSDDLSAALERLADRAPHDPGLAGAVRRRARRGRRRRLTVGAAALAVVAAAGGFRLLNDGPGVATVVPAAVPACRSDVTRGVLPEWARTGFSDPEPVMPFVRSASGNVVAILFAGALYSPPRADPANKVLWTWHDLPSPAGLRVTARLEGTGPATSVGLPVPAGPSYVDLPAPGCWRLTITWPTGHDTVDLRSVAP
jgi:hypothetical protein